VKDTESMASASSPAVGVLGSPASVVAAAAGGGGEEAGPSSGPAAVTTTFEGPSSTSSKTAHVKRHVYGINTQPDLEYSSAGRHHIPSTDAINRKLDKELVDMTGTEFVVVFTRPSQEAGTSTNIGSSAQAAGKTLPTEKALGAVCFKVSCY
jgi:hypothetical protein